MNLERILNSVDHTLLTQTATWEQIAHLCDEGVKWRVASVCIPSSYVRTAADYLGNRLPVCTVIGFPNGYSTTAAKCFEASEAVQNGASEIDRVIHLGLVKQGRFADVGGEIERVKQACGGRVLKVIVETCLLTVEEKTAMCRVVSESAADFIKTSTGFSTGGATLEDIEMFRRVCSPEVKIKAAGGIRTLKDAELLLNAGADRLGSSSLVRLCAQAAQPVK